MKYLLGIDQGGTKTAALVCDISGNILGVGFDNGLAGVYFDDTEELYLKRIVSTANKACAMAGIVLGDVSAVCGGLSGADWEYEYAILTDRLFRGLKITDTIVLNDCIAAMRGGSAEKECAVVCAGSGLNIAVRRADGKQIIYGYYIDNAHQGAEALGAMALRKVVEASLEISEPTSLTKLILAYTGYDSAEKLLMGITSGKYKLETKTLAPLLLKAYITGDSAAICVVKRFSMGISRYVTAGMQRLGMSGSALNIVFSGSVFKDIGTLVADKIFDTIAISEPKVCKIHARYEPVCGAALTLLDREYNGKLPTKVVDDFDKSVVAYDLLRNLSLEEVLVMLDKGAASFLDDANTN